MNIQKIPFTIYLSIFCLVYYLRLIYLCDVYLLSSGLRQNCFTICSIYLSNQNVIVLLIVISFLLQLRRNCFANQYICLNSQDKIALLIVRSFLLYNRGHNCFVNCVACYIVIDVIALLIIIFIWAVKIELLCRLSYLLYYFLELSFSKRSKM